MENIKNFKLTCYKCKQPLNGYMHFNNPVSSRSGKVNRITIKIKNNNEDELIILCKDCYEKIDNWSKIEEGYEN